MPKKPLEDRLREVTRRSAVRDRKTIQEAAVELEALSELDLDVDELELRIKQIEKWRVQEHAKYPDAENVLATDRLAAAKCLQEIVYFLDKRAPSESVRKLHVALSQLALGGATPPLLQPVKIPKGRRPDTPQVISIKGMLAAFAACKQREGLTRNQAARWIVANTSPELSRRISEKKISASTVEEWLARYGGEHPPDDHGGAAYRHWTETQDPGPLTKSFFQTLTAYLAEGLPPRKSDLG